MELEKPVRLWWHHTNNAGSVSPLQAIERVLFIFLRNLTTLILLHFDMFAKKLLSTFRLKYFTLMSSWSPQHCQVCRKTLGLSVYLVSQPKRHWLSLFTMIFAVFEEKSMKSSYCLRAISAFKSRENRSLAETGRRCHHLAEKKLDQWICRLRFYIRVLQIFLVQLSPFSIESL
jgi:hypothetical protein